MPGDKKRGITVLIGYKKMNLIMRVLLQGSREPGAGVSSSSIHEGLFPGNLDEKFLQRDNRTGPCPAQLSFFFSFRVIPCKNFSRASANAVMKNWINPLGGIYCRKPMRLV